jgi:hypothetical protein
MMSAQKGSHVWEIKCAEWMVGKNKLKEPKEYYSKKNTHPNHDSSHARCIGVAILMK